MERSAIKPMQFDPSFFFKSSIFFLFVPVSITLAPNNESFFTIDPPIAPEAPVTKAVLFFNLKSVIKLLF